MQETAEVLNEKSVSLKLIDRLLADYKKPEDLIRENGLLKQHTKRLVNAFDKRLVNAFEKAKGIMAYFYPYLEFFDFKPTG